MDIEFNIFPSQFKRLSNGLINDPKPGDTITFKCMAKPPENIPSKFHIDRGCCDGTNLTKCFADRQIEKEKIVVDKPVKIARVKSEPRERFTL